MSRDPNDRPAGWGVGECLWSPRRNEIGRPWAFWETMREVQPGDVIFHLCGKSGKAAFVGFSTAASSCLSIDDGPSGPQELYRVELSGFVAFPQPLVLNDAFAASDEALRGYFESNRQAGAAKERLFYVVQAGRLQCLNGAYLSFLSDQLLSLLFGVEARTTASSSTAIAKSTATGVILREAAVRVGQQGFARNVKKNYGYRCCFPGCTVDDPRFLVGAHIARWADNAALRGETSNGFCFCLLHDRAFEVGAFTFDAGHRVVVRDQDPPNSWLVGLLESAIGKCLSTTTPVSPSADALAHHWASHGYAFERQASAPVEICLSESSEAASEMAASGHGQTDSQH